MDPDRFEALSRLMSGAARFPSRRALLGTLVGGLVAALAGNAAGMSGRKRRRIRRKNHDGNLPIKRRGPKIRRISSEGPCGGFQFKPDPCDMGPNRCDVDADCTPGCVCDTSTGGGCRTKVRCVGRRTRGGRRYLLCGRNFNISARGTCQPPPPIADNHRYPQ